MDITSKWINGTITRFTGTGTAGYSGDEKSREEAQLNGPTGIAIDQEDNVYIADFHNNAIRRVDSTTGIITTIAGCGKKGLMVTEARQNKQA